MAVSELQKLLTLCDDPDHLHAWIEKYTGLDFPNKTISRFSNSNPFDFIWQVYRSIVDGKSAAFLGLAGRDSMKTLSLSVIDLLAFLHDHRNIVHVAMTTQQGSRARNYLDTFINKQELLRNAVVKQNTREIRLGIGNMVVGLEIVPATPKAVQGSHASVVTFDEIASSIEPNNVRAYKDAHGILGSSEKGKPAVIVKITSRQMGFSLAEQELRDANKSGLIVMRWTTLDATERCPEERSGVIPTPLWVDPLKGDKYTDIEFKGLADGRRESFNLTNDTFDGCRKCPIAAFCQGDLKKQTSRSLLLRTIDDVINKIRLAGSWDWGVAQIMSLQPSKQGTVYFEFDRTTHIPGWDKMWEALTGAVPTKPIDRDTFIRELKKRGANFYAGVDWGWSSPSTCVVMAVDRRDICYVVEAVGRTYMPDPEFIELLRKTIHRKYDVQMYCPDLASGSGNALLRQASLPTTDDIDKTINLGVNLVKGLLRVPGTNGATRFYLAPDLISQVSEFPGIYDEFDLYHKKVDAAGNVMDDADPESEHNHYLDALRYMTYWLFGRMRMKLGSEFVGPAPGAGRSNIPSLSDIAREHGLQFSDNREPGDILEEQFEGPKGPIWEWT